MKFKDKFLQFKNKYSPNELLSLLELLIKKLIKNIIDSGNISLKAVLSPILLVLIILLYFVIILKKFFKNIFKILRNIFKLLRRFFLLSLKETIFYWEKAGNISSKLLSDITYGINKMFHYIGYLFCRISDDDIEYIPYNTKHNIEDKRNNTNLFFSILQQVIIWLLFIIVSIVMSLLVLTAFFSGFPVLHEILRNKISPTTSNDTIEILPEDDVNDENAD